MPDVSNDRIVLFLLHAVLNDDVEVTRGGGEDVNLGRAGLSGHLLYTLEACLQSAEGENGVLGSLLGFQVGRHLSLPLQAMRITQSKYWLRETPTVFD